MKLEGEDYVWPNAKEINPPPQEPLHSVLRWILDQMNVGCAEFIDETRCAHRRYRAEGGRL